MNTELRPTPETDATSSTSSSMTNEAQYHALILAQSAFEAVCKERDEALALLASEKATRNAIIAKGVEMEKQLEAMREAINAANVGLQSAMQYILSLPYFGNLEELETTEKVQAALAKLKPLLP